MQNDTGLTRLEHAIALLVAVVITLSLVIVLNNKPQPVAAEPTHEKATH